MYAILVLLMVIFVFLLHNNIIVLFLFNIFLACQSSKGLKRSWWYQVSADFDPRNVHAILVLLMVTFVFLLKQYTIVFFLHVFYSTFFLHVRAPKASKGAGGTKAPKAAKG